MVPPRKITKLKESLQKDYVPLEKYQALEFTHQQILLDVDYQLQIHTKEENQQLKQDLAETNIKFFDKWMSENRMSFPIQNFFALTVHKIQALNLPEVSLSLDAQGFVPGQAYVALSHRTSWKMLGLMHLQERHSSMIKQYEKLEKAASEPLLFMI
ncbi:8392_t:CDS:2 [Entrophospora sp. SA101]|nr:13897_t:CDS:2 [Entrophospora sp. SA101]CAJ0832279.1 14873_t:CDS:2 [Entrophospora sp. SA101]CAJ0903616.1 8392_t:CDS:2 [Entrophospora sp. SA101]